MICEARMSSLARFDVELKSMNIGQSSFTKKRSITTACFEVNLLGLGQSFEKHAKRPSFHESYMGT